VGILKESMMSEAETRKPAILHVCSREMLRPIRDEILRLSGYVVDSTMSHSEGLAMFQRHKYDLVLIDVEGETGVHAAEELCTAVKHERKDQVVGFVCNWRVAVLSDCPNDIVRTEFNPESFVQGVKEILEKH
jgi:DNA-binding response OmpR family regulator